MRFSYLPNHIMKKKDYSGQRFGKLLIIREAEPCRDKTRLRRMVLCKCDCGTKKVIRLENITAGKSASCGCVIVDNNRARIIDLQGKRFNMFTVIKYTGESKRNSSLWLCRCDCGAEKVISQGELSNGTKSCGCLMFSKTSANKSHGKSGTEIYRIWRGVMTRCYNSNHHSFEAYGGKGITVCDDWHYFDNFYRDVGDRPSKKYSLDRIDNSKGYSPDNCRWATRIVQARSQDKVKSLTYNGETKTLLEWAEQIGITVLGLQLRLEREWPLQKVISTPPKKKKPVCRTMLQKTRIVWYGIKDRCYNQNATGYKNYGARGIKVCNRWLESFDNFLADMGERPSLNHSIDRIDVNSDYCPENCKWSTTEEQANNKTINKFIFFNGSRKTLSQWAKEYGLSPVVLSQRLKIGWSMRKAVTTPVRESKKQSEVCKTEGCDNPSFAKNMCNKCYSKEWTSRRSKQLK